MTLQGIGFKSLVKKWKEIMFFFVQAILALTPQATLKSLGKLFYCNTKLNYLTKHLKFLAP